MKKLIVDTDPGVDDALALALLAAEQEAGKVEVLAVTTVAGNARIGDTTRNALRILEYLGLRVPVYRGASRPLARSLVTAEHYHGWHGMPDIELPEPGRREEELPAPAAIARILESERAAVLALGPLTNLAIATILYPWIPEKASELVVMGGAYGLTEFGKGNVNRFSEFNFYVDPEAARLVVRSWPRARLIGLDVTQNPALAINSPYPSLGRNRGFSLLSRLLSKVMLPLHPHDPLAAAEACGEGFLEYLESPVDIVLCECPARGAAHLSPSGLPLKIARGFRVKPEDARDRIVKLIARAGGQRNP